MMWGELEIGCLIGSLRGESLPCIDLNSVFLGLQVVNTAINMKNTWIRQGKGTYHLKRATADLRIELL